MVDADNIRTLVDLCYEHKGELAERIVKVLTVECTGDHYNWHPHATDGTGWLVIDDKPYKSCVMCGGDGGHYGDIDTIPGTGRVPRDWSDLPIGALSGVLGIALGENVFIARDRDQHMIDRATSLLRIISKHYAV